MMPDTPSAAMDLRPLVEKLGGSFYYEEVIKQAVARIVELEANQVKLIAGTLADLRLILKLETARVDLAESLDKTFCYQTCPTCGGTSRASRPLDAKCPAWWAHKFLGVHFTEGRRT